MNQVAENTIQIIVFIEYRRVLKLKLKRLITGLLLTTNGGIKLKSEVSFMEARIDQHRVYIVRVKLVVELMVGVEMAEKISIIFII